MALGALPYSSLVAGLATSLLLVGRGDAAAVLLQLLGFPELAATLCQEAPTSPQVTALVNTLTTLCSGSLAARPGTFHNSDERSHSDEPFVRLSDEVCRVCEALGLH